MTDSGIPPSAHGIGKAIGPNGSWKSSEGILSSVEVED